MTFPLPLSPQCSVIMLHDAARVPSPKDGANGVAQPVVAATTVAAAAAAPGGGTAAVPQSSGAEVQQGLEEEEEAEPILVKKPHREILDHERKRRVELKCMELQEMMEEQG